MSDSQQPKKRRPKGGGALGDILATKQAFLIMQAKQEEERQLKTERLRIARLERDRTVASDRWPLP